MGAVGGAHARMRTVVAFRGRDRGGSARNGDGGSLAAQGGMLTILLIILLLTMLGGGFGHSRLGYAGWSPAAVVAIVLIVLLLMGRI